MDDKLITPVRLAQLKADAEKIAKEPLTVEQVRAAMYYFGSELACLRLFAKINTFGAAHHPHARVGYSANRSTWYFVTDMT
jgi:hypothetical protein